MRHFFHNRVLYGMIYSSTGTYTFSQEQASNPKQKQEQVAITISFPKPNQSPCNTNDIPKTKNIFKQQQQWQFHTAATIKQALLQGLF